MEEKQLLVVQAKFKLDIIAMSQMMIKKVHFSFLDVTINLISMVKLATKVKKNLVMVISLSFGLN